MPAGQDFERVMQIIQEFEVSMNWKSNAGDKVGDDESMILFEHYETIKQGYVIKRREAMPDPVKKLIDELDEIQKKIFKEVQQN